MFALPMMFGDMSSTPVPPASEWEKDFVADGAAALTTYDWSHSGINEVFSYPAMGLYGWIAKRDTLTVDANGRITSGEFNVVNDGKVRRIRVSGCGTQGVYNPAYLSAWIKIFDSVSGNWMSISISELGSDNRIDGHESFYQGGYSWSTDWTYLSTSHSRFDLVIEVGPNDRIAMAICEAGTDNVLRKTSIYNISSFFASKYSIEIGLSGTNMGSYNDYCIIEKAQQTLENSNIIV